MKSTNRSMIAFWVAALILVAGIMLISTPLGTAAQGAISSGLLCDAGDSRPCIQLNWGRDIAVYSDGGATRTFYVKGSSGDVTVGGMLTATAVYVGNAYVGITPVATATKISVATEIAGIVVAPTGVVINGTPVVPYATPVMLSGATPLYCVFGSTTVTGTATIANHGLTTPLYAIPWLAQTATGDALNVYSSISGVTVTLGVMNSALTPVANSTGATVKYEICGTK